MPKKENLKKYADEYQLEIYKNFPTTHYLSNQNNVLHILAWATFWRRNLHRFAMDYLKINLYEFQQLTLYEMGLANVICIIASRNDAKSFMIALYACCRCILYPGTKFVIGSATKGQAKLIVSEKIQNELMSWSPVLTSEIEHVSTNVNDTYVKFKNGSKIIVYTANDNARGNRSNESCREEFRMIKKRIEDSVIAPFQTPRNLPFLHNPYYSNIHELFEPPVDIYISSSYIDNGDIWMWDIVDQSFSDMLSGKKTVLLTFDEAVALKHKLKLKSQLIKERKKQDPISWKTEFLNLRVKDSLSSYFTYAMLSSRQISKQVFYPRNNNTYKTTHKNKYSIPKLDNEIRVISNDIAFVAGSKNDNSVYSCIRGVPETQTFEGENGISIIKQGYREKVPYIESNQYGDTNKQAVRIRQLFEDFEADYIVLDCRNGGIQILYNLQKPIYDEERGIEYPPLMCMNNDDYAKACTDVNAPRCIYAINASANLNSEIARLFRSRLTEGRIDFLVNFNTAQEEILSNNKDYISLMDLDEQLEFERPFLETQAMVTECAELQYEKMPNSDVIRIYEKGKNRKDRYTSVSYGSYFFDMIERDNMMESPEYEFKPLVN